MKSMQKMVLEHIESIALSRGVSTTLQQDWANTGRVFVFFEDGPRDLRYSFQSSYVQLDDGQDSLTYYYTKHWEELMNAVRFFVISGYLRGSKR